MNLRERIAAHNEEAEALENLLEPILHKAMSVYMPLAFARGWDLKEFDTDVTGSDLLLTAYDWRDQETKTYTVPIWATEGDIDAWVATEKEKVESEERMEESRLKLLEALRLEEQARKLREQYTREDEDLDR